MINKEILEEVAEGFLSKEDLDLSDWDKRHILKAMVNMTKWQAERMYSEEEVKNMLQKRLQSVGIFSSEKATDIWFKQYTKII